MASSSMLLGEPGSERLRSPCVTQRRGRPGFQARQAHLCRSPPARPSELVRDKQGRDLLEGAWLSPSAWPA